jgi:uncharacterized membrane protein
VGLKLLFIVIGVWAGCVLGNASTPLALAVLGGLAGWWWPGRKSAAAPAPGLDTATLLRRLIALEREVGLLRGLVAERSEGAPAKRGPDAEDAAPARAAAAMPRAAVAPAPVAPLVVEAKRMAEPPAAGAMPTAAPAPIPAPRRKAVTPAPALALRDRLPPVVSRWIFGGNTIVKAGVLILFLGLAFLLRYTAERVTLPIEVRYAGVALVGVVLTAIGWRLRDRRDAAGGTGYGLILQGSGIGVFYLTALAAQRLDPLLTPALAFAFMALVAVFGALLAVLQDAPWLALVAVAEGFAAPALVSTGSAAYMPLMSYLSILDAGILAMAWYKAWRPLNLVGAVATFALTGAWARSHYTAADYAGVQAFLAFFFLLFTLTGVLFARRALAAGDAAPAGRPLAQRAADALRDVGRVDSTLTFGVPLAAFSLQYLLVRDFTWGPAWAAMAFALVHILLGGLLVRGASSRYALLGEAHVIVGTIFTTLAIPLALQGAWTGATWAIEAAGMYWLGARQRRTYARAFALLVMAGAALKLVAGLSLDLRPGMPLLAGSTLGMAMLALALGAMDRVRRSVAEAARTPVDEIATACVPFAAACAFTALAWMRCPMLWAGALTAWIAYGCAAAANRLAAPSLRLASVLLHLGALTAMTLSLQVTDGASISARAWQDLVAALAIGAALLATGWLGQRDAWQEAAQGTPRPIPLGNSIGLVSGLGVASASLLFKLAPADAALAWPFIGLASAWLGMRLRSGALVGAGLALQVAAGVASLVFEPSVWRPAAAGVTVSPTLWIPLVLTATGLALGDRLRARDATVATCWWQGRPAQWALVGWTLVWWSRTLPPVIWRALEAASARDALQDWPHWQLIWATLTAAAAVVIAHWRGWRVLGQASLAIVPVWILAAAAASPGSLPSAHLGWLAWLLALGAHPWLSRMQRPCRPPVLAGPLRLAGWWVFIALATRECTLRMATMTAPGSAWNALAAMAVPATVLVASIQPAVLQRWKDATARDAWLGAGCVPLALYLLLWLFAANTGAGDPAPLPWVPLFNPLETGAGVALLAIVAWARALPASWRTLAPRWAPSALAGATAFALATGMVLRTCHHWAGVPWSAEALFASTIAQAALSIAWSLIGVALMVAGHRRARRGWWAAGAALLAVVVVKLFLVELADRASLERIVSFIVVGGLMLAVGYFAPMPPRRGSDDESRPAVGEAA